MLKLTEIKNKIDISNFDKGVYFVLFKTSNGKYIINIGNSGIGGVKSNTYMNGNLYINGTSGSSGGMSSIKLNDVIILSANGGEGGDMPRNTKPSNTSSTIVNNNVTVVTNYLGSSYFYDKKGKNNCGCGAGAGGNYFTVFFIYSIIFWSLVCVALHLHGVGCGAGAGGNAIDGISSKGGIGFKSSITGIIEYYAGGAGGETNSYNQDNYGNFVIPRYFDNGLGQNNYGGGGRGGKYDNNGNNGQSGCVIIKFIINN